MFKRIPRPKFFLIIFIVLAAILIYNNFLIVTQLLVTLRISHLRSTSYVQHLELSGLSDDIMVEKKRIWIINNRVAQYSSKVIVDTQANEWTLEAIVLYEWTHQEVGTIRSRLKFLVQIGAEQRFFADPVDVYAKETQIVERDSRRYIWKLRAHLHLGELRAHVNELVFLVTDFDEYQKVLLTHAHELARVFLFHKPIVYFTHEAKKRRVAHCVHQVRGMRNMELARNMMSWLRLQRDIGVDRVRLYFNQDIHSGRIVVKEFLSDEFVEIVDYSFTKSELCKRQLEYRAENPNSYVSNYSLRMCERIFDVYFAPGWTTFHTHEMTATNDCFTNFKYQYEFVTNYDFDELLVPRQELVNRLDRPRDIDKLKCDKSPTSMMRQANNSLYEYAVRLFSIVGRDDDNKPIGALHFQHVLMIDKVSDKFLLEMTQKFSENLTISSKLVEFAYENKSLNFAVARSEHDSRAMNKSLELIRCLNASMGNEMTLRKWNRVFGIWLSVRHGKSIYNTNLTEFVNQHYGELFSQNAKWVNVPLDQGFSSHFRDPIDNNFFLGQTYSLSQHFRVDLEYYRFLAQHAADRYSSFLRNFFG